MESVVGPLLVEELLEVATTAGGESLEKEREWVWVKRATTQQFPGDISDSPKGVAVDSAGNIYVTSKNKLQKFSSTGVLIKCIGRTRRKEGEFADPRATTIAFKSLTST